MRLRNGQNPCQPINASGNRICSPIAARSITFSVPRPGLEILCRLLRP